MRQKATLSKHLSFVVTESSVNWCGGLIKQLCKHRQFHSAAYQCSKPVVHGGYALITSDKITAGRPIAD